MYFENNDIRAWANLHGWNIQTFEDRKLIVRQAALNVLLQLLIPELRASRFQTPLDQFPIELPQNLVERVRALLYEHKGVFNFWGDLHNRLIPQAKRRRIGQFWTDENLANLMTLWLLDKHPKRLLDIGCGAGNFLLASQRVNVQVARCGMDISPLLLNVTFAAHLTHIPTADLPSLTEADFLTVKSLASFDAAICNPPYTRHHDIQTQRKDNLQKLLKSHFHFDIPRQGTLAFYFLLNLIAELPTGAHAAVIVPI